jgi:hypothetical protein
MDKLPRTPTSSLTRRLGTQIATAAEETLYSVYVTEKEYNRRISALSDGIPSFVHRFFPSTPAYIEEHCLDRKAKDILYVLVHPFIIANTNTAAAQFRGISDVLEEHWALEQITQGSKFPPGGTSICNIYSHHIGFFFEPNGLYPGHLRLMNSVDKSVGIVDGRTPIIKFSWGTCSFTREHHFDAKRGLIYLRTVHMKVIGHSFPVLRGIVAVPLLSTHFPTWVNRTKLTEEKAICLKSLWEPRSPAILWLREFERHQKTGWNKPPKPEECINTSAIRVAFHLPEWERPRPNPGCFLPPSTNISSYNLSQHMRVPLQIGISVPLSDAFVDIS